MTPVVPTSAVFAPLRAEIQAHQELDLVTLLYHIEQSDATATDGYWHAAVNEARSALESLLRDIVLQVGPASGKDASGNGSGTPFSNCRKALVAAGFLEQRESDVLHFAYGLSSAKGSHAGVTDEAWARLSRQMVANVIQYVLRRYAEWKRHRRVETPASGSSAPSPSISRPFRWLLGLRSK